MREYMVLALPKPCQNLFFSTQAIGLSRKESCTGGSLGGLVLDDLGLGLHASLVETLPEDSGTDLNVEGQFGALERQGTGRGLKLDWPRLPWDHCRRFAD